LMNMNDEPQIAASRRSRPTYPRIQAGYLPGTSLQNRHARDTDTREFHD
jgi:hypothetical protein